MKSNSEMLLSIKSIDLEKVKLRLVCKMGWIPDRADKAIEMYYKYLYLVHCFGNIEPTADVDEVWHAHILHTKMYYDDCMRVFGQLIHHYPAPIDSVATALCGNDYDCSANIVVGMRAKQMVAGCWPTDSCNNKCTNCTADILQGSATARPMMEVYDLVF